ncbi:MAG: hypothetical protein AAGE94_21545, partial [Acidobacteriota bacterium]
MPPAWSALDNALDTLLATPVESRLDQLDELSGGDPELRAELAAVLPYLGAPGPLDGGLQDLTDIAADIVERFDTRQLAEGETRYRRLGPYELEDA